MNCRLCSHINTCRVAEIDWVSVIFGIKCYFISGSQANPTGEIEPHSHYLGLLAKDHVQRRTRKFAGKVHKKCTTCHKTMTPRTTNCIFGVFQCKNHQLCSTIRCIHFIIRQNILHLWWVSDLGVCQKETFHFQCLKICPKYLYIYR